MDSDVSCSEAPDISGIGVRIAFYIQTVTCGEANQFSSNIMSYNIGVVLLTGRSLSEALSSVWTLLGTSFGLTISAIVAAIHNDLPLYQGIVVTYLVWLANFALLMSLASYARHPHPSKAIQLVAIPQIYFSTACTLYIWAQAPSFGSESHIAFADRTVFVVLFHNTSAVRHGRIVALTVVVTMILGYLILVCAFLARRLWSAHEAKGSTQGHNTVSSHSHLVHHRDTSLPPLPVDPHLLTLLSIFSIPYVVTVICIELQLARNHFCSRTHQEKPQT